MWWTAGRQAEGKGQAGGWSRVILPKIYFMYTSDGAVGWFMYAAWPTQKNAPEEVVRKGSFLLPPGPFTLCGLT